MQNNLRNLRHLYNRAGFGFNYNSFQKIHSTSINDAVDKLFEDSKKYEPFIVVDYNMNLRPFKDKNASPDAKKTAREEFRDDFTKLNTGFLDRMAGDTCNFRERMTFFWHGYFAARTLNLPFAQQLNNVIRENAFGNFGTLLTNVSKSPEMIQFLSNQQNHKEHPNENFGRELMELFTIGRGNYSEDDVKAAARSFTGWSFNANREFIFRPLWHDYDEKTFLGKTGKFDGDDIISILLGKKQTAHFVASRMCRFFVSENTDPVHVSLLGEKFYETKYDIGKTMKYLFTSDWFYDERYIGTQIKSPVELIVGLQRQFPVTFNNPDRLILIQKGLGQLLFSPPNVSGWKGGKNWIDSTSLLYRLKLPSSILNSGIIDLNPKEDIPEEAIYMMEEQKQEVRVQRFYQTTTDWDKFNSQFNSQGDNLKKELSNFLLSNDLSSSTLEKIFDADDKDGKSVALKLISLPEYQLC